MDRHFLRRSVMNRKLINSGFAGYNWRSIGTGPGSTYSRSSGTTARSTGSVKAMGTSSGGSSRNGSTGSGGGAVKK